MDENNFEKRYIRISRDSGCYLENYKSAAYNDDTTVIVNNNDDKSGRIKINYARQM